MAGQGWKNGVCIGSLTIAGGNGVSETVDRITEYKEILGYLVGIGNMKNLLPLSVRGHAACLGLHVQLRHAAGVHRLSAGGKLVPCFDVVTSSSRYLTDSGVWRLKKFDKPTWNTRFAHILEPTFDIACFLVNPESRRDEVAVGTFNRVVEHFRATGEWLSLPSDRCCPNCGHYLTGSECRREQCGSCGAQLTQ